MADNEIKDINGYKLCDEKAREDIVNIVISETPATDAEIEEMLNSIFGN